jgi:hypothetical protein
MQIYATTILTAPDLLDRLDGAGKDRGVARERVGDSREQRQPGRVTGGLPQDDERVARQQLAVEDPGAVEAGGFDVLDEAHELGHRCCAGNAQVNADGLGHITAMVIFPDSDVKPGMR